MALAAPLTLGEIRDEVLKRVGAASQGNLGLRWHAKVESMIRSATRQLYVDAPWTVLEKTVVVPLTEDNHTIDWPDDSEPGSIESVVVIHSETGKESPLSPGLRTNERESARTPSGRPILYTFVDGDIFITPAPNEFYTTAKINYRMVQSIPMNEGDEVFIDSEAVIMQSAMAFKRDQGLPVSPEDRGEFERYLSRLRAKQGDGSGLVVGGAKTQNQLLRNRVTNQRARTGNNAPMTEDWNPY